MNKPTGPHGLDIVTAIVRIFRGIDREMPVSWIEAFMVAAEHDGDRYGGISITDLADKVSLTVPTVSRILRILGDGTADRGGGSNLLTLKIDVNNHRIRRVVLTTKGRALLRQLEATTKDC